MAMLNNQRVTWLIWEITKWYPTKQWENEKEQMVK